MIQSVDSVRLASEIDRCAKSPIDVLIEVNIGEEASKCGVAVGELSELIEQIAILPNVKLKGLMTIPPYGDSVRYFEKMQRLYEDLKAKSSDIEVLSMGMSGDYEDAILHGATIVRLGTALFGNRI
jgi:pyridoxal phosphate enzyme (YggS family)